MRGFYVRLIFGLILGCCSMSGSAQSLSTSGVKVSTSIKSAQIKIFPNPATDRFKITVPEGQVKYITINNIIGKRVKKVMATSDNAYDVDDLTRGVYIIRIFDKKDELIKALRLSKT